MRRIGTGNIEDAEVVVENASLWYGKSRHMNLYIWQHICRGSLNGSSWTVVVDPLVTYMLPSPLKEVVADAFVEVLVKLYVVVRYPWQRTTR